MFMHSADDLFIENCYNQCSKIAIPDFNTKCQDYEADSKFGIFHLNIRSINHNFSLLRSYLVTISFKFHIIVLTETWLKDIDLDGFALHHYRTFSVPSIGRSGGIRVYVCDSLSVQQLKLAHGNPFQSVNLKISLNTYGNIFLSSIYKSPSTSNLIFNDEFEATFDNLFRHSQKLVFIGDFNLNLFNFDDVQTERFYNYEFLMLCALYY